MRSDRPTYYRADIDGLRALAVGLVIAYHVFPGSVPSGFLGVDVFFVISGFVVTQALRRNLHLGVARGLSEFYARRVKRILPALYANLLATTVLCCLFVPPSELRSLFKTAAAAVVGMSNLALLHARFDYFAQDLALNPFVQTWSLGVEEQFYLVFPALLLAGSSVASASRRFRIERVMALIAAASFVYWARLRFEAPMAAFYNPLARIWELLAGTILALNMERAGQAASRFSRPVQFFAVVALGAGLAPAGTVLGASAASVSVAVGTALAIAAGIEGRDRGLPRWLASAPLAAIGRISYSLYLWHYSILAVVRWNHEVRGSAASAAVLAATVGFAALSYLFVEVPFRSHPVRGLPALARGAAAALACLAIGAALYALPPSRLYLGNAAAYSGLWPAPESPLGPTIKGTGRECHLEYGDALRPDLFERCSTPDKSRNFIFLMGNSHAQHLVPMVEDAAKELGYGYSAVTISNCRLVGAVQIMTAIDYRYDLCKDYFDSSLAFVLKNAKRGDVVLVGDRSLLEKPSAEEEGRESAVLAGPVRLTLGAAYAKSQADMRTFAAALRLKGATLVLAGPTPQFPLSVTQCNPEWFRPRRADCALAVSSVRRQTEGYSAALRELAASSPNAVVWDPLPALCRDGECLAARDGHLLYRDQHHFSTSGARALVPGFLSFVRQRGAAPVVSMGAR